jgi:hypothetical protein
MEAKQATSELIFGKEVPSIEATTKYGCTIADVVVSAVRTGKCDFGNGRNGNTLSFT